jgi:hypothetical protein
VKNLDLNPPAKESFDRFTNRTVNHQQSMSPPLKDDVWYNSYVVPKEASFYSNADIANMHHPLTSVETKSKSSESKINSTTIAKVEIQTTFETQDTSTYILPKPESKVPSKAPLCETDNLVNSSRIRPTTTTTVGIQKSIVHQEDSPTSILSKVETIISPRNTPDGNELPFTIPNTITSSAFTQKKSNTTPLDTPASQAETTAKLGSNVEPQVLPQVRNCILEEVFRRILHLIFRNNNF